MPAVREVLGRLSALEATLGGMIHGQIEAWEPWPEGFATFNRRYMYAALNWGNEMYSQLIEILRELSGGSVFQMPGSVTVIHDPALRKLLDCGRRLGKNAVGLEERRASDIPLGEQAGIAKLDSAVILSLPFAANALRLFSIADLIQG